MNWVDAVDQFVEDYTLVLDNDADGYREELEVARSFAGDRVAFAEYLRGEWDDYVDQVAEQCALLWGHDAPATLLIRQMMGGWGDAPWYRIADHYFDRLKDEVNV